MQEKSVQRLKGPNIMRLVISILETPPFQSGILAVHLSTSDWDALRLAGTALLVVDPRPTIGLNQAVMIVVALGLAGYQDANRYHAWKHCFLTDDESTSSEVLWTGIRKRAIYVEVQLTAEEQPDEDLAPYACEVTPCSRSPKYVNLDERSVARPCWLVSAVA
jgi:hypothetical protein